MVPICVSREVMTYLILKVRKTLSWLGLPAKWQLSSGKTIQAADSARLDVSKMPGNLGRQGTNLDNSPDLTRLTVM